MSFLPLLNELPVLNILQHANHSLDVHRGSTCQAMGLRIKTRSLPSLRCRRTNKAILMHVSADTRPQRLRCRGALGARLPALDGWRGAGQTESRGARGRKEALQAKARGTGGVCRPRSAGGRTRRQRRAAEWAAAASNCRSPGSS